MPGRFYVEIDRSLGTRHPEWGFIYPVNYGFVPNQPASDGDALDAYVLVPEGVEYTDAQVMALLEFQERFFESTTLRA